jgi:hypothetical protein
MTRGPPTAGRSAWNARATMPAVRRARKSESHHLRGESDGFIRVRSPWQQPGSFPSGSSSSERLKARPPTPWDAGGLLPCVPWTHFILIGDSCAATACHLPFGIFTHVSLRGTCRRRAWGLARTVRPFALNPPVAMAVSPNAVTWTSSYAALESLRFFGSAKI